MRRLNILAAGLIVSVWISSCVKIHTDNTGEQTGLTSEYKAERIRADWKDRIQNASPVEKAGLLVDYFEMITGLYFQVGYETIDNWRTLERQTQRTVDSAEVQAMIDQWHEANRAYIAAHDYNVDYAAREIRYAGYFAESFLEQLDSLLDAYRRVRAAVLYPSGSLVDYEFAFKQLEFEVSGIAQQYRERLKSL